MNDPPGASVWDRGNRVGREAWTGRSDRASRIWSRSGLGFAPKRISVCWIDGRGHPLHRAGVVRGLDPGTAMQPSLIDSRSLTLHPGDQPVAGFRLVRSRGRGGFGEVWEAEASGGFLVALKFVQLSDQARAAELRALDFVRGIHHPNLLANFGSWLVGQTLVIGMELADQSLWDRYLEANQHGLRGIPRGELLGYLGEVAAGIDHLNGYRHTFEGRTSLGIQHRDIKPPNILLFGGGAKVADLGMARAMEGEVSGHTGIWTFAYAAPEFFRGQTTRQSDQYGLAVTYCQLRGGRLPFSGSAAAVTAGHLFATPDLDALPESERPIVERALAKMPGDRWPDCRAFVAALRAIPTEQVADILLDTGGLSGVTGAFPGPGGSYTNGSGDFAPSGGGMLDSPWLLDTAGSGSLFEPTLAALPDEAPTLVLAPVAAPDRAASRGRWWRYAGVGLVAALVLEAGIAQAPGLGPHAQVARVEPDRDLHPVVIAAEVPPAPLVLVALPAPTGPALAPTADPQPEPVAEAVAVVAAPPEITPARLVEPVADVPELVGLAGQSAPDAPSELTPLPLPLPLPAPIPAPPAPVVVSVPAASLASPPSPARDVAVQRATVPDRTLPVAAPALSPAEAAFARGRGLFIRQDFAHAAAEFDESIRLNPAHTTSYLLRAIARHRAGNPTAALADYAEVIRARPDDVTAHISRGQAYHELGDYGRAIADYSVAIGRRPGDGDARFRRGLAQFKAGDYAGAITDFTETLRLDRTNAYAAEFRAEATARRDAKTAQTAPARIAPTSPALAQTRPGPAEGSAPVQATSYRAAATPAATAAATNGKAKPQANPATQDRRRAPIRRILPWPFTKPK